MAPSVALLSLLATFLCVVVGGSSNHYPGISPFSIRLSQKDLAAKFCTRGGSASDEPNDEDLDDGDSDDDGEKEQGDVEEYKEDVNEDSIKAMKTETTGRQKMLSPLSTPFKMKSDVYSEATYEPAAVSTDTFLDKGSASMLESEDGEDRNGSDSMESEEPAPNGLTDVAKLWWVNVWTHHLSAINELEEQEESEEDIDLHDNDESEEDLVSLEDIPDDIPAVIVVEEKADDRTDVIINSENGIEVIEKDETDESGNLDEEDGDRENGEGEESLFISSGAWISLDAMLSLGLSVKYPALRVSRRLRGVRKAMASATGLHGAFSGKPLSATEEELLEMSTNVDEQDQNLDSIRQRLAAIQRARDLVNRADQANERRKKRRGWFGGKKKEDVPVDEETEGGEEREDETADSIAAEQESILLQAAEQRRREAAELEERLKLEEARIIKEERLEELRKEEKRRMDRVREIDRLMSESQTRLQKLVCEKDVLQRRPNPLWNYTVSEEINSKVKDEDDAESEEDGPDVEIKASRKFTFPPPDLVDEYLEMIFSTGRIVKMNHALLWKESDTSDDDDEETIGDDLLTPSADAHKLYSGGYNGAANGKNGIKHKNKGGGSWLLRRSLGKGRTLGEKIGEAAETAAYKAVCTALMSFLARLLSSLHGINVMQHSDIRLVLEQTPDLPPVGPGMPNNYAQETIKNMMKQKSKKSKKSRRQRSSDDSFVQRDAVVEMLLSHCQISAPLLKLFPLEWQRAILGNVITLSTAIMSDFFDGLQFQILGHQLSFAFRPITEADMMRFFGLSGNGFNRRRAKPEQFEAAIKATALDVSEELKFLDRWHERLLGSGVLRTQIANLIARIVLTLTDEVLSGARIDLWSAQAGGPRLIAGLEHRVKLPSFL